MLELTTIEEAGTHLEAVYQRLFKSELAMANLIAVIDFMIEHFVPESDRPAFEEKLRERQNEDMQKLFESLNGNNTNLDETDIAEEVDLIV